MSPENDVLGHLPQQWVGICAIIMFTVYILAQIIEKYPLIARLIPLGTWWHERQKTKRGQRGAWVAEDNQVIQALQEQISSIAGELHAVRETLRAFTAWSVYDARWHHKVSIDLAMTSKVSLPDHLDYFDFERAWRVDPIATAKLPC